MDIVGEQALTMKFRADCFVAAFASLRVADIDSRLAGLTEIA